jgi:pilus assembly protein CpaE
VVLNKQDAYKRSQLAQRDFEDTLKLRLAARLPFEPLFGQIANDGQMLGELAATHRVTEAIFTLAARLAKKPRPKTGGGGIARAWDRVATRLKIAKVVN